MNDSRRAHGEQGVVMVAFAILLVVILGVIALVVDIGFVSEKTRQIQTAADSAALAAAQSLPNTTAAESTAKSYASTNLPDGNFAWASCTDSPVTSLWHASSTPCIQYDSSYTYVKVKLPWQTYPTMFGKVLKVASLGTTRSATARIVGVGFGSIQPFALYSGFNSGLACLKTTSGGHKTTICDPSQDGNFGLLDIRQYGNATIGTTNVCAGNTNNRLVDNLAFGADHQFSTYDPATGAAGLKLDNCVAPQPNELQTYTGNVANIFDKGIASGTATDTSDKGGARLKRGNYAKRSVYGNQLDNKPLWEFIPFGLTSSGPGAVPSACFRESFPSTATQAALDQQLDDCFNAYDAGQSSNTPWPGVVFGLNSDHSEVPVDTYDIQKSPRFAYVPQFWEDSAPNGTGYVTIKQFRAIFMWGLFANCNGSTTCAPVFEPGPATSPITASGNSAFEAMDAWVFNDNMLPATLRGNPTSVGQNNYVQLVK